MRHAHRVILLVVIAALSVAVVRLYPSETLAPTVADDLDSVRGRIRALKADSANLGTCHDRMHEIGGDAYAEFGLHALDASDEWCNAGYIHGIIEAALSASTDPLSDIATLCADRDPGTFAGWECWHGVGHGLMDYTYNDLPKVIAMCRSLPVGGAECVNGAFMENAISESDEHVTVWRRDDDSFFPCDGEDASVAGDCYLYAPVWYLERHDRDYAAAFDWCLGADGYVSSCVRGVGAQAMKDGIADPEAAARICASITSELREDCIAGMTGIVVFHNASVWPAEDWCANRDAIDRPACQAQIRALQPMF